MRYLQSIYREARRRTQWQNYFNNTRGDVFTAIDWLARVGVSRIESQEKKAKAYPALLLLCAYL